MDYKSLVMSAIISVIWFGSAIYSGIRMNQVSRALQSENNPAMAAEYSEEHERRRGDLYCSLTFGTLFGGTTLVAGFASRGKKSRLEVVEG